MKKTLMIDMDNTIAETIKCVICNSNADFIGRGVFPKYDEIVNPDLFSIFGCDVDYVWEKVLSKSHTFIKPVIAAVSSINALIEESPLDVYINTARNREWKKPTIEWLNHHGLKIDPDKVIFTKSGQKYINYDNNHTIIIEDNIMELKRVKKARCLLFDRPWSKTYALADNIKVIQSWPAALYNL